VAQATAQRSTDLLRTSDHQPYKRLREFLIAQGADPQTDVLADFFSNDIDQEFGVLVTTARRVFTFSMHYGRRGDLNAQVAGASIHEWNEITKRWRSSPYQAKVSDAMLMLDAIDGPLVTLPPDDTVDRQQPIC
jgi:hypothetical protein